MRPSLKRQKNIQTTSKIKKVKEVELTFLQRRYLIDQRAHEKRLNITNHQGNASQYCNKTSPHACQRDCYQRNEPVTNAVRDREIAPCALLVGMQSGVASAESSNGNSSQNKR
jgi:hypothetical protein